MTKKEFKEAMLRGHGRCVIAVRKDPERYREFVLWACKKDFAYDAQSEGTRSWYVYTMAKAYPDKETFIRTTAEALKRYRPNGSWDLLHLSEVLMFFALDGHASAREDEDIACFLQRESACIVAREEHWAQQMENPTQNLAKPMLSRWLAKNADKETIDQYAISYREQTQPKLRAEELAMFSGCPYPDDPHAIIQDSQSDCEELRSVAWRALENIRHPAVREFALNNVCKGIPHPKHLLPILYEYNPCSFCRKSALSYMSKHRMLTKAMLEECRFDSYDEIREMAYKRVK